MQRKTIYVVGVSIDPDEEYDDALSKRISAAMASYAAAEMRFQGHIQEPTLYEDGASIQRHTLVDKTTMLEIHQGKDGRRIAFGREVDSAIEGREVLDDMTASFRAMGFRLPIGIIEWTPSAEERPREVLAAR